MPNRGTLIYVHLLLAALFLPWMLILPLSGGLYILGVEGVQTRTPAFSTTTPVPEGEAEREAYFRAAFAEQGLAYRFDYIRANKGDLTFRPTTRAYYTAQLTEQGASLTHVHPSMIRRMMELHKGHGPPIIRWFEALFGLALISTALSGIWVGWQSPRYRKPMLIAIAVGTVAVGLCLL